MAYKPTETTTHFVATLDVQRVERTPDPSTSNGQKTRTIDEVTKIVVKAPTLMELKSRLRAYVNLIHDFTDPDDSPTTDTDFD